MHHGYMVEILFHLQVDHDNASVLRSFSKSTKPKSKKIIGSQKPSGPSGEKSLKLRRLRCRR